MNTANPYLIQGPALIAFSGGRTSGMMLKRIIDAHGGALPDDVLVAFANTGKEREETLRFVHECETRWRVSIHWLEFVTDLRRVSASARYKEVCYATASRKGEPLDRLIARKKALFSTVSGRWCTERCKVGAMFDMMEARGYLPGQYTDVIGFRADEYDRAFELPRKPRNAAHRFAFPLATDGVRKSDVLQFWAQQPFDLGLERGTGNCDHCPFLSFKLRVARARRDPEGVEYWAAHERAKQFNFGRESFAEVLRTAQSSPLFDFDDDGDIADSECGAWCDSDAPPV